MDERNPDHACRIPARALLPAPPSWSYAARIGRVLFSTWATARGLAAFALITFGVIVTKFGLARDVTFPAIQKEQARTGTQLLPMFLFISVALGLVRGRQTISWLKDLGGTSYLGRSWSRWWCANWAPF